MDNIVNWQGERQQGCTSLDGFLLGLHSFNSIPVPGISKLSLGQTLNKSREGRSRTGNLVR